MAQRKKQGTCRICGRFGDLSLFEHVPPESAFNDRPIQVLEGMEILAHDHDPTRGRKHQRGAGRFTLCAKCNNDTGSWYGNRLRRMRPFAASATCTAEPRRPSLYLPYRRIYPLPDTFCGSWSGLLFSANGPDFRERHPYLVRFVLNKYLTGIPPAASRFYCYLQPGRPRRA